MISSYYRALLSGLAAMAVWSSLLAPAAAQQQAINGIYICDMPADYDAFGQLVRKYKDSGADSIIVKPVSNGAIDNLSIAKAVFFAHDSGLKLFVVLPTRALKQLVIENPDWEDLDYNPRTGTTRRNGKLDLFNPSVSAYLIDLFKDVASYSIDGIILDDDFYYGETEGQSRLALKEYKLQYGSSFSARKALGRWIKETPGSIELYGEDFWNLAELKKNTLLTLFKNIVRETRSINRDLKFGVSLHVPGLFLKEKEIAAWYSHDLKEFRNLAADFFWLKIPHRDIREQGDLNYRKSMEAVARRATATGVLLKEENIMIAIQAVSASGKTLPLTEIEEVSLQVKKAGNPGIAFMVTQETELPSILTRKLFNRQVQ